MSAPHPSSTALPAEPLDDDSAVWTLDALARTCCMDTHWVTTRLQEGLLQKDDADNPTATATATNTTTTAAWRFRSETVVRARRMAHLEVTFDADPQLAALTVDLIEEVTTLRQQLRHLQAAG